VGAVVLGAPWCRCARLTLRHDTESHIPSTAHITISLMGRGRTALNQNGGITDHLHPLELAEIMDTKDDLRFIDTTTSHKKYESSIYTNAKSQTVQDKSVIGTLDCHSVCKCSCSSLVTEIL
jgi:hypothetical protein